MNNYKTLLSVCGMFRSGTTLLARMLHTHSKIIIGSDALAEFFKAVRNEIYYKNGVKINPAAPFESLFNYNNSTLIKLVEKSDFNIKASSVSTTELIQKIRAASESYSPLFSEKLAKTPISGNNYLEIFNKLLDVMRDSYYKPGIDVLGFKTVWAEQLQAAFLNTAPNGKVIFIVRDPRAVVASNFVTSDHHYPLEFLIRQWRKSIFYALLLAKINQKYKERCFLIKYEDLIGSPKESVIQMLKFLNLNMEDALLDPSNFKDGKNERWVQNTSYSNPEQKFNKTSIEKWRQTLSSDVIKFIEYCCYPEMVKLGYNITSITGKDVGRSMVYPDDDVGRLAGWIKEFYPVNLITTTEWKKQISEQELKRNQIYTELDGVTVEEIENYFIDKTYYDYITQ
jgi:hypothetical protein